MRVLHLLDHSLPTRSGYSIRTLNIILEQRRLGWTTFHLTGPKQESPADGVETASGLEFFRTSGAFPRWARRVPLDAAWSVGKLRSRLATVIREVNPDIIHAHSPVVVGLAALGQGRPLVYEMRTLWEEGSVIAGRFTAGGLAYRAARRLETFLLRRADAVTTISAGLRGDIIARGVSPDDVTIVPNAVSADDLMRERTLDAAAARARFGVRGSCVLGYVGSLFAWEGLPLLVQAMAGLRSQIPDIMLLIVGTGPDEAAIRHSIARHDLTRQVVFAGELPHQEAVNAYAAIDLLVYPRLPSRITELVTPLKPLEAMALGQVCIASDVGGQRELIEDRVTGLLFRAGDPGALGAVILQAMADPQLRASIAARGPVAIRSGRTWAQSVANYRAAYARAAQRFAARH